MIKILSQVLYKVLLPLATNPSDGVFKFEISPIIDKKFLILDRHNIGVQYYYKKTLIGCSVVEKYIFDEIYLNIFKYIP